MNTKAPDRPEARLPKGLQDVSASEIRARDRMLATIRDVFESYGFEPFDTPGIEYSDALGKFLPDQDRPNEGVFSFQDDDEQWLSLRYDLTAPLARYVAQNPQLGKPFRRYQVGPVWRNEKPGPGRFRQFTQFDADTVGASSVAADAELCMLAADTLEALGVKRGQYLVRVNSRKLLDGIMEVAGISDARQRLSALRAIDKLDRLGIEGVTELLGEGRTDASGDRTEGAKLNKTQVQAIVAYLNRARFLANENYPVGPEIDEHPTKPLPKDQERFAAIAQPSELYNEGMDEVSELERLVRASGYSSDRIRLDFSVVRGLEYYTGPVFEAELTAPIKDTRGQLVRLGSVVSGGRYDGLVERFTGEKVPATGISIGVSRLLFALQLLGKYRESAAQGPVVILVLDRARIADYQRMAQDLRNAGIRAELYLGESDKMGAQIKYADRRGSPCAVIQGDDEWAKGEVTIKDLILGANLSAIKDRDEYLKKQAEAQFSKPADELVEAVKGVLARHQA